MKEISFLANVNVKKPIVDFLIKRGFDVKWVANIDKKCPTYVSLTLRIMSEES
jgi:hypothetical protein